MARVLYVDDEPGLCRLFTRLFSGVEGFDVSTLTSAMEAVNLIRSTSFDVIVSDLKMPEINGLDLLAGAKRDRPEARRMLVSAYADFGTALEAINRGRRRSPDRQAVGARRRTCARAVRDRRGARRPQAREPRA